MSSSPGTRIKSLLMSTRNDMIPTLGRVNLSDLSPTEGLPSESYKQAVTTLSQSLSQYSAAIIQFPQTESSLLKSGLDSAKLYFHQRDSYPYQSSTINNDPSEWCKTSGYYAESCQESYEFRPGLTLTEPTNSPSGLVEIFGLFGKASRLVLDGIGFYLNLRSSPFIEILDNVPLRNNDVSSSVLSVCCYGRGKTPSFRLTEVEEEQMLMYSDHDKSLLTFVKPDKPGLRIRDVSGQWILVDVDLGFNEAIVYPGLALYQATAGYVNPAMYRTDEEGRFSLVFKLMPKSMTNLSCSEMRAAGHGVEAQFQSPVSVDDFMMKSQSLVPQGSTKKKGKSGGERVNKPLPPSKRLRLEAQRVLKGRVQEIADKKGIKLRFCSFKECESSHGLMDSPCGEVRREIGWPDGVPFVHPHDLPNKAKIGFLETYEPGWSETDDGEMNLEGNQHMTNCNHSNA